MTTDELDFDSLFEKQNAQERERFQMVIDEAREVNPSSTFVRSCQNFLDSRGFLSDKQMSALENVEPYCDRDEDDEWDGDDGKGWTREDRATLEEF